MARRFPVLAAALLLLAIVVVFFPTLFFGRVASPWDVVMNDPPWRAVHHPVEVANPELKSTATSVLPLMLQARRDGAATAVLNPYLATGVPGTLALNSGVLGPTVLPFLPLVAATHLANATILARLVLAFVGMTLFLRQRGLGEAAAVVGGSAWALAAPLTAQWLAPASATAAALPLLLWACERTLQAQRPLRTAAVTALAWLALLAGGAPGVAFLGGLLAVAWVLVRLVASPSTERRARARGAVAVAAAAGVATAILAPSLALLVSFAGHSGVLEGQVPTPWGTAVLRLLLDPTAFGDPRHGTWAPPEGLEALAYGQAQLSIGWVALALAAFGVAGRRRERLFWVLLGAGALLLLAVAPGADLVEHAGLLGVIASRHLGLLAALALAVLAGLGTEVALELAPAGRRRAAGGILAAAVVLGQGLLAGHLTPYLNRDEARLSTTAGLATLQLRAREQPARIAPLLDALWPDTAAAFGLEDLRSQFASTGAYRQLLQEIDPQAWGHFGRMLQLNAATADLLHPYLAALGARWVVEPPATHLVEYSLGQQTLEIEPRTGLVGPIGRAGLVQELTLPPGCSRIGVHGFVTGAADGVLRGALVEELGAHAVARWRIPLGTLAQDGMVWLDLPRQLPAGRRFRLQLGAEPAGTVLLRTTATAEAIGGRLLLGRTVMPADLALSIDLSGYAVIYDGPDLRIWENRRAAPRFWPVRRVVAGGLDELLQAEPPIDLQAVALVEPAATATALAEHLGPGPAAAPERLILEARRPARYRLRAELAAPALLVSSLPAVPAVWRARVDGRSVAPLKVNGLFIGLPLPAGTSVVEIDAGLHPLWYGGSLAGGLALLGLAIVGMVSRKPPSRS